jgi:prepilin peptidase CpaA
VSKLVLAELRSIGVVGLFELLFLSAFPAAMVLAALTDIYDFKIPNWISVLLVVCYLCAGALIHAPTGMMIEGMLFGCAMLVVGFILFAVKFFGGGDAKLLAATAPWIGLSGFSSFLFITVFAGGILALVLIAFRRAPMLPIYAHAPFLIRMHQNRHEIPYAVAIVAGGLLSFSQTPMFQLVFRG